MRLQNAGLCAIAFLAGFNTSQPLQPQASSCQTSVILFLDVSLSAKSATDLMPNATTAKRFLAKLKTERRAPEVSLELIPFGTAVGASCGKKAAFSWQESDIDRCIADNGPINQRTDLLDILERLSNSTIEPLNETDRQVFLLLSDFLHDTESGRNNNASNWAREYQTKLESLKQHLDGAHRRKLIFIEQRPGKPLDAGHPTLASIGAILRSFFRVISADSVNDPLEPIDNEITNDSSQLKVTVNEVTKDSVEITINNPACDPRTSLQYSLRPQDGISSWIPKNGESIIGDCPATLNAFETKTCKLTKGTETAKKSCCDRVVRAEPVHESWAAGESKPFTLGNCFRIERVDIDVLKNVDGSESFRQCALSRRRWRERAAKQKSLNLVATEDPWVQWKKNDANTQSGADGKVEFIACVQASGSLFDSLGEFGISYSTEDFTPPVKVSGVQMDRFMDGSEPGATRSFPIFFYLSRKSAIDLCHQPHEERSKNLFFTTKLSGLTDSADDLLLTRDRDRDAEEELHDAWESIIIPLLFVLGVSFVVIIFSRRRAMGAVEETIAFIGIGAAAFSASLHDATNRGDQFEKHFADDPIFWTKLGLYLLGGFLLTCIWLGVFEPTRSSEVARYAAARSPLWRRFMWLVLRLASISAMVIGLVLWARYEVENNAKAIEECHYLGYVAQPHD